MTDDTELKAWFFREVFPLEAGLTRYIRRNWRSEADVPDIGTVKVEPNTVLDPNAFTSETSGVVLLPERAVFTAENMDQYDF